MTIDDKFKPDYKTIQRFADQCIEGAKKREHKQTELKFKNKHQWQKVVDDKARRTEERRDKLIQQARLNCEKKILEIKENSKKW